MMMRWGGWLVLLVLLGCAQEPARALKVATNQWVGYEPLYLARYIDAYQQNVDVVQLPSATDVMRALRNGNVDVAATTLDEALLLASQGEDLVVLMALDFSSGADVVLARPPIASLKDLRGQRVGVENTGLGALMLSAALEVAGLAVSDIKLVKLTNDQHESGYRDGAVDAVVTFEPAATRLRNSGAVQLFDSSAVPDLIVDVLVARRAVVEQREAGLRDLVNGYYKARDYMQSNPHDANSFFSRRLKMTPDELRRAFSGLRLPTLNENVRWLAGTPSSFDNIRDRLAQLMQEHQLLEDTGRGGLQADGRWLVRATP